MDKRTLIYHPLRWREIHHPYDVEELFVELTQDELAEAGIPEERLAEVRSSHDGFETAIESFEESGSNIFHLQPALVEMFRNSSVDEISMDSLKTPFEHFYVHFGAASQLQMEGMSAPIEGAYVSHYTVSGEICFCITLTTALDAEEASQLSWLRRLALDTCFEFTISSVQGDNLTVGQAFDAHFVNWYAEMGPEKYQSFSEIFKEGKTYEEAVANWKPDEKYRDPAIRPALNLVFNAICYLAYEKREVVERYPAFAPERLVKQAVSGGTQRERNRGRSKLESIGFRQIYFCGDTIQRRMMQTQREGGGSVSAHWRRGHWRHQAHGVGLSLRKLIWIEPVMVKEGTGEASGHVYVSKPAPNGNSEGDTAINLTGDSALTVLDLLENPPEPKEALKEAMRRRQDMLLKKE